MNRYICPSCGGASYSAADMEDLYDTTCPYCGAEMKGEKESGKV